MGNDLVWTISLYNPLYNIRIFTLSFSDSVDIMRKETAELIHKRRSEIEELMKQIDQKLSEINALVYAERIETKRGI